MTNCAIQIPSAVSGRPATLGRSPETEAEIGWRVLPSTWSEAPRPAGMIATRWQSLRDERHHVRAQTPDDFHLVCIVLRRMSVRLSVAGELVHDGILMPGTMQVTRPGVPAECVFRGAYDALHLHISDDLLAECAGDLPGGQGGALLTNIAPSRDPLTERLGMALLSADQLGSAYGPIYAHSLSIAIVSRLLALRHGMSGSEPTPGSLVKWRLQRALDYIEAHLGEQVGLAEIAAATGLSRMHFAAQFRAATGLRPHEYLLRRRVERAQQRLLTPNTAVMDVALEVGFQTQAHFTNVFKRFVGQPPHAWRQTQDRAA